jgi:4-amino-4-deoxy-L-arabinose transferase-like glycosyltransferase
MVKQKPWSATAARLSITTVALVAIAIAMRVSNAIQYPLLHGFDEVGNWRFIQLLEHSFALPDPESDWSTAHPPFFYAAAAALCRLLPEASVEAQIVAVRLGVSAVGLGLALAVALFVRRAAPQDPRRALLAAALVLFLPAHITMSAMAHEELLAALFTSLAVIGIADSLSREPGGDWREFGAGARIGLIAGLAWITKLSGGLVAIVAVVAFGVEGWRRRQWRKALLRITAVVVLALVAGGWYYGRNWMRYGYFYPHALPIHAEVIDLPPGERSASDYLNLPLATWLAPRVPSLKLMHSVWGSTYASTWFDAHHFFLPARNPAADRAGTFILLLAVLPTVAFGVGAVRGLGRCLRGENGSDLPLLLLMLVTLSGYVLFTWRNPYFVTAKGYYLLGLCVPFGYWSSEVLAGWLRRRFVGPITAMILALLAASVIAVFSYGLTFERMAPSGLPLQRVPGGFLPAVPRDARGETAPAIDPIAGRGAPKGAVGRRNRLPKSETNAGRATADQTF